MAELDVRPYMYSPSAFSISNRSVIREFVRENNFGIVISRDGEVLHDTHTPLLITEDLAQISGHIARGNNQWRAWVNHRSVKIIFHGPHSYVSPHFYKSDFNVPTWNYTAVSIEGTITIIEDRKSAIQIIQDLINRHEGQSGWALDTEDERYVKLFDVIICFSVAVDKIEVKFKLNQNKSDEDKQSVISHLLESSNPIDHQTAKLMQIQV